MTQGLINKDRIETASTINFYSWILVRMDFLPSLRTMAVLWEMILLLMTFIIRMHQETRNNRTQIATIALRLPLTSFLILSG